MDQEHPVSTKKGAVVPEFDFVQTTLQYTSYVKRGLSYVGDTPSIDSTLLYKLRISLDLQLIHKVDLVGAKAPSSFIYLILKPVGSCMLKLLNGERHKLSAKPVVWARMYWKSFFNMLK